MLSFLLSFEILARVCKNSDSQVVTSLYQTRLFRNRANKRVRDLVGCELNAAFLECSVYLLDFINAIV